jgi:hypothetical protein
MFKLICQIGSKIKIICAMKKIFVIKYSNNIAGNDIGLSKIGQLRAYVEEIIRWMGKIMPNTTINWSRILPHLYWR